MEKARPSKLFPNGPLALRRCLDAPDTPVGIADGHLPGPVMGVFEPGHHLDGRIGFEHVGIGHPQGHLYLSFLTFRDLGDEDVRTATLTKLARAMAGREFQIETECLEELGRFAPIVGRQEQASMPSVVMSGLLSGGSLSAVDVVEVGGQGLSHQSGQRRARVDGVVLDLFDQTDRQIHVELFDFLIAHSRILASYHAGARGAVLRAD